LEIELKQQQSELEIKSKQQQSEFDIKSKQQQAEIDLALRERDIIRREMLLGIGSTCSNTNAASMGFPINLLNTVTK
jgi:hypothetical protein